MTLIVGEPVSIGQVNQALRKVTIQEEEQEDSESSPDSNEGEEEKEEGAVGSVGIGRRGQISQKAWDPLEQDKNREDFNERFRRPQRESNPVPQREKRDQGERTPQRENKENKVRLAYGIAT